jgi:hypothetical protein
MLGQRTVPFMDSTSRKAIAARLRGLLAGQDGGDLAVTAGRLHVDEVSLRMSLDEGSPYPTLDVLAAVVALYGVDPSFLVTGDYNRASHRAVLEGGHGAAAEAVKELAYRSVHQRVSLPPAESAPLRLA